MYLTIKELADYLSISEAAIEDLILHKKIRAVFDGDQYLVNKDQFTTHMEQIEKYKQLIDEILQEPIPEDIDVRDED
ncbi:excisionase family DNA-binding protein [Bacillus sp. SM2101]|uniref:excisionase family DNA-binding protein n=1 Tax=Bacillus sp. SM2101 TaxID=2805366 RepID=UPI001BDF33E0|nr:excisionase family DNA-binding protein [Bacillus sp. SM2101]